MDVSAWMKFQVSAIWKINCSFVQLFILWHQISHAFTDQEFRDSTSNVKWFIQLYKCVLLLDILSSKVFLVLSEVALKSWTVILSEFVYEYENQEMKWNSPIGFIRIDMTSLNWCYYNLKDCLKVDHVKFTIIELLLWLRVPDLNIRKTFLREILKEEYKYLNCKAYQNRSLKIPAE